MDLTLAGKPAGVELHAAVNAVVRNWTIVDYTVTINSDQVRHFFWGYTGDPYLLTSEAADCMSNVIFALYGGSVTVPPVPAVSRR
jgi:hypothetical protein